MDNPINIVVTDDHKLFRMGISALLSDFGAVGEIYEAGNGKELICLLDDLEQTPDLVLLDINMPEMDGVETTKVLKVKYPDIRIVILSMEDDTQLVSHLVSEGVNGYLLKNADPEELEIAIKKVMRNDFYFSGSLSGAVLSGLRSAKNSTDTIERFELNERELEVIHLICEELTAAEIAEALDASRRTIEGVKRKLLEKTGARNMAGLVVFAVKNNLVNLV